MGWGKPACAPPNLASLEVDPQSPKKRRQRGKDHFCLTVRTQSNADGLRHAFLAGGACRVSRSNAYGDPPWSPSGDPFAVLDPGAQDLTPFVCWLCRCLILRDRRALVIGHSFRYTYRPSACVNKSDCLRVRVARPATRPSIFVIALIASILKRQYEGHCARWVPSEGSALLGLVLSTPSPTCLLRSLQPLCWTCAQENPL